MFYETRHKNATKYFRVLSFVIYDIIENYVCIDSQACQSKKISFICMDKKYQCNSFNEFMGIDISDF